MINTRLFGLCAVLSFAAVTLGQSPATQPAEMIQTTQNVQEIEDALESGPLVIIQEGTLPIIISAPHGGRMVIPDAPRRTGKNIPIRSKTKRTFSTAYDSGTRQVALMLADTIEKKTGKRPYVVAANFSRRFVDANRSPEQAYESDAGQAAYDTYHDAIRKFRGEILAKYNRGLLIDIHGHGRDAKAIIRGTADWTSVRHLVEEFGKESIIGPEGLLGPLAAAGNKFIPPVSEPDTVEFAALNGGFITRNYGSYQGGTFDSIQLELGTNYRKPENMPAFADKLADGVIQFDQKYLRQSVTASAVPAPPTTAPAVE